MEEEVMADIELKADEVAEILACPRRTALYYMQRGKETGGTEGILSYKPYESDRIGYRTSPANLMAFAKKAGDGGFRERRVKAWMERKGRNADQDPSVYGSYVLKLASTMG